MNEDLAAKFIEHHGVKGQKWGVRKDNQSSGSSVSPENIPKVEVSSADQAKNLAENKQKSLAKHGVDTEIPDDDSGFHITGKQIATVAVGAAFAGALLYGGYKVHKLINYPPGDPVNLKDFNTLVASSQISTWGGQGFVQASSFDRPEFTIPAGHTIHRLSTKAETSLSGFGTYSVSDTKDFDRYVSNFRHEKGAGNIFHHVTFNTTEDVKVPNLRTTLDTLKEVMTKEQYGLEPPDGEVIAAYNLLSGGKWKGQRDRELLKALGAKGYGAIVDEMDAGVIGDRPMVFFSDAVGQVSSKVLSSDEIKAAESNLFELTARKRAG